MMKVIRTSTKIYTKFFKEIFWRRWEEEIIKSSQQSLKIISTNNPRNPSATAASRESRSFLKATVGDTKGIVPHWMNFSRYSRPKNSIAKRPARWKRQEKKHRRTRACTSGKSNVKERAFARKQGCIEQGMISRGDETDLLVRRKIMARRARWHRSFRAPNEFPYINPPHRRRRPASFDPSFSLFRCHHELFPAGATRFVLELWRINYAARYNAVASDGGGWTPTRQDFVNPVFGGFR